MIQGELRGASCRGVPCFFEKGTTTRGRMTAFYNYLNSGRRVQKDLGPFQPEHSITVFTKGIGPEYFANRDALITALDNPTPFVFVHPFGGNFTVKVGKYTYTEEMTSLGKCYFDLPLKVVSEDAAPITPANRRANSTEIRGIATQFSIALQSASADAFANSTPLNYESSSSIVGDVFGTYADDLAQIGDTVAQISEYTGEALAVAEQASFYVDNPLILFATMADGILGVDGLTTDVFAKYLAVKNLFLYGFPGSETDPNVVSPVRINPTSETNEDAERQTNSEILTTFVKVQATAETYAQTGNSSFTTTNDIDRRNAELESQFEDMADLMTSVPPSDIYQFDLPVPDYSEAYDLLKDLRNATTQYLDQQSLNAAELETLKLNPIPASVLSYTLYKDSERSDEIMDENGIRDNMALSGDVVVLSE